MMRTGNLRYPRADLEALRANGCEFVRGLPQEEVEKATYWGRREGSKYFKDLRDTAVAKCIPPSLIDELEDIHIRGGRALRALTSAGAGIIAAGGLAGALIGADAALQNSRKPAASAGNATNTTTIVTGSLGPNAAPVTVGQY